MKALWPGLWLGEMSESSWLSEHFAGSLMTGYLDGACSMAHAFISSKPLSPICCCGNGNRADMADTLRLTNRANKEGRLELLLERIYGDDSSCTMMMLTEAVPHLLAGIGK